MAFDALFKSMVPYDSFEETQKLLDNQKLEMLKRKNEEIEKEMKGEKKVSKDLKNKVRKLVEETNESEIPLVTSFYK